MAHLQNIWFMKWRHRTTLMQYAGMLCKGKSQKQIISYMALAAFNLCGITLVLWIVSFHIPSLENIYHNEVSYV
jgi:hypothetical protein